MKRLRDRRKLTPSQRYKDRKRAVRALGRPLAASSPIHHHSLTQLVICQDVSYHWLLHAREQAIIERDLLLNAGADPLTEKRCHRCGEILIIAAFESVEHSYCGECRNGPVEWAKWVINDVRGFCEWQAPQPVVWDVRKFMPTLTLDHIDW